LQGGGLIKLSSSCKTELGGIPISGIRHPLGRCINTKRLYFFRGLRICRFNAGKMADISRGWPEKQRAIFIGIGSQSEVNMKDKGSHQVADQDYKN
jgi:hypothetical protein